MRRALSGEGLNTVEDDRFSLLGGLGCHLDEPLQALVIDVIGRPFGHLVSR